MFETLKRIFLADGNPGSVDAVNAREYRLLETTDLGRGTIRLTLEGVIDANMAETLKGKNVFVEESELPPAGENEFYYRDVIGCEVILADGRRIGTIEEIIATGANDVFVVREDGKEVLVPVIADVVKSIDVGARRVVIEAIPGLLD